MRAASLTLETITGLTDSVRPEDTHKPSQTGPACGASSPCSGVQALANTLKKHVPGAYVIQGEAGAPSTWERGGAMANPPGFNWTETRQAKWNLRSLIGDAAAPLVAYSSVFSAVDVCYAAADNPGNIGNCKRVSLHICVGRCLANQYEYHHQTACWQRRAFQSKAAFATTCGVPPVALVRV